MKKRQIMVIALVGAMASVAGVSGAAAQQCGGASWYSLPGQTTASGQKMSTRAMTAAHKSLPFGTKVKVINERNGKSVVLTINDRGPFVRGRIIDVTPAAASVLGFKGSGVTKVCISQL